MSPDSVIIILFDVLIVRRALTVEGLKFYLFDLREHWGAINRSINPNLGGFIAI